MVGEDGAEEVEALCHSVLCVVLLQHLQEHLQLPLHLHLHLVILAAGCQEHHQQHILETMDPLLPFISLSTDINLKQILIVWKTRTDRTMMHSLPSMSNVYSRTPVVWTRI